MLSGKTVSRALVAGALLALGCGSRPERVDVVPVYRLSVTPGTVSWLSSGQRIAIAIEDARSGAPGLIGANTEEKEPVPIHENPPGAAKELIASALAKELGDIGANFVQSQTADRVLRVKLLKFWVHEDNTYNGDVRVRVLVEDNSGTALADVLAVGTSKRFGRSLSVENYQETIENMVQSMIEDLFQNTAFKKAFSNDAESAPLNTETLAPGEVTQAVE